MNPLVFEAVNVVKRFPGTLALDHVTFRVYAGAVNVLIGENGAGKSTLMRLLAGIETADEGTFLMEGRKVALESPRDADRLGVRIVHQELSVMPNLNVSDNIFAGRELVKAHTLLDRKKEDKRSIEALARLRTSLSVNVPASQLSLGCRQLVELARAIAHGAKVLILDEPTSALSSVETESLFAVIEELRRSGVAIIYISHRLHELMHLGDYFTVLRSGRVVGEAARNEVSQEWIMERMSGRAYTSDLRGQNASSSEVALGVNGLSSVGTEEGPASSLLHDISFSLHRGEILGIYGVLGAGRTELLETLAGDRSFSRGEILLEGRPVRFQTVTDGIKAGVVLVPEDRQRDGLIPELSIRQNIALAAAKGPFLSRADETRRVRELVRELNIAAIDLELPVAALSGGNQQKVLLARCLMRSPKVLLLDEPTRGVDVGAKAEIYRILRRLAAEGLSILFTSSEIEETHLLCDRALVMRQGTVSADLTHGECTAEVLFAAASPSVSTLAGKAS